MKRMLAGLGAIVAAAGLAATTLSVPASAAPDFRDELPTPDEVKIVDVKFQGTGCNKDNTSVSMSNANKTMSLLHSEFVAEAGQIVNPNGSQDWRNIDRKACTVALRLDYPQGWTFAVATVIYRGYMDLAKGAVASQIARYNWAGDPYTGDYKKNQSGPYSDIYAHTDKASGEYADCEERRSLNYSSQVNVNASRSPRDTTSVITLDSQEIDIATSWDFSWKRC